MHTVWERRSLLLGKLSGFVLGLTLCFAGQPAWSQEMTGPALLETRCSGCHPPHEEGGKLDAIEHQRKPPEAWEMTIYRMLRTHGANLEAGEARILIKYLSDRVWPGTVGSQTLSVCLRETQ